MNKRRNIQYMEITLKLSDVLNLNQTLKAIIDDNNTKVDVLLKFKLLGIMKGLENHISNFEIIRNEKINEYGKETEDGNIGISKDDEESMQKFNNDLMKILNSEVTVSINKLKATDLFNKGVKAEYLIGLYSIIEE